MSRKLCTPFGLQSSVYINMYVNVHVHRYPEFAPMFKAELWDPDEWANLFKEAGAKCELYGGVSR